MPVHHQSLHLAEHGGMGGIRVGAEHPAGHQYLDGRLFAVHDPDLPGRGVGPQKQIFREPEGILHIPGRVILQDIEPCKVMIVVLDLRTLEDFKAHAREHIDDFILYRGQGMKIPHRTQLHRDSHVYGLPLVFLLQLKSLHLSFLLVIFFLNPDFHLVHELAIGFFLLLGHLFNAVHKLLDRTALAEILLPHIRELHLGFGRFNFVQERFSQFVCIEHVTYLLY